MPVLSGTVSNLLREFRRLEAWGLEEQSLIPQSRRLEARRLQKQSPPARTKDRKIKPAEAGLVCVALPYPAGTLPFGTLRERE